MFHIDETARNVKGTNGVFPHHIWDQGCEKPETLTRFDRWARNGFGPLLLPAGNPKWPLSPGSKITGNAAKVPAILHSDGYCRGFKGWNTRSAATRKELQYWQQMGVPQGMPSNVSLRTGFVPEAPFYCGAIDIDVECAILALMIADLAQEVLGRTARRARERSNRVLLLYRLTAKAGALAKITRKFASKNGDKHLVEIILSGSGPQFIAEGNHSNGTRYEWPDGYPIADELPEIDVEDIEQFLGGLGQ
jgi:Bifunctional DNA primase/polymerase, N-terminal